MIALIHNYGSRLTPLLHNILISPELRQKLIANIIQVLLSNGFVGVNIDFEFVPPQDRHYLTLFMAELYSALQPMGLLSTMAVPAKTQDNPAHAFSGAYDYPALANYTDQMQLMAYDENFSQPGPIGSIGFVQRVVNYALSVMPREKIRLGMAVYGRDWSAGSDFTTELSWHEAVTLAYAYGQTPRYDYDAQEWTFNYTANGVLHTVWFEDVRSFQVRLNYALQMGLPGIVMWRMGYEDPRIWDLLKSV